MPLAADAQQAGKVPRIGFLYPVSAALASSRTEAFVQGLREFGYIEGQNITIEWRLSEVPADRLSELAAELVRLKVDVIVTGGTPAAFAARKATSTIPIVMSSVGDPVATGLVATLARPGGNITGLSLVSPDLAGKRLELIKESVPGLSRVAILVNLANPIQKVVLGQTEVAARSLGMQLQPVDVRDPRELESAFAAMAKRRAGAVIVPFDPIFFSNRRRIVDLAAKSRLPAIYFDKGYVEAGGLMAYGPNIADLARRAATYVDRILKGAKPADLPVEQPTRFELVINLKTAKALGLTIPQSVLFRADHVIQ
ncbi:MAG: ABC transporter substrate-binding protein [Candidatus Rokubacteria bacterium]|nr:ABC transporter substrate-binding protein [Candidatus Rokubacteria bacterium]